MGRILDGMRATGATTKMIDALFVQYHRTSNVTGYKSQLLVLCYGRGTKSVIEDEIQKRSWGDAKAGSINPFLRITIHDVSAGTHNIRGRRYLATNVFEDNSLDMVPDVTMPGLKAALWPVIGHDSSPQPSWPPSEEEEEATASPLPPGAAGVMPPYYEGAGGGGGGGPGGAGFGGVEAASPSFPDSRRTEETMKSLKAMMEKGLKPTPSSPEGMLLSDWEFKSKYLADQGLCEIQPRAPDQFNNNTYDKWGYNRHGRI